MKVTEKQIEQWKAKHGELFMISVDNFSCILHKPTRKDLSYASVVKDPIKMGEVLLKQCWVEGDKEIQDRDDLFIAVINKLEDVLKVKEAEIKKL